MNKRIKLYLLPVLIVSALFCSCNEDGSDFQKRDNTSSNVEKETIIPVDIDKEDDKTKQVEDEVLFLVRWLNYDGSVLEQDKVAENEYPHYNGATPQGPSSDDEHHNFFIGWDKDIIPVTSNIDFTAKFELKKYTYSKLSFTLSGDEDYYTVSKVNQDITDEVVIPATYNNLPVRKIDAHSFSMHSSSPLPLKNSLTGVYISNGIEEIGDYAFAQNDRLESVYIPSSVKTICSNSFRSGKNIENLVINDGVKYIGEYAFLSCRRVKNFSFPETIIELNGNRVFNEFATEHGFAVTKDCQLELMTGEYNFSQSGIISGIFPKVTKHIGTSSFYDCKKLTYVKFGSNLSKLFSYVFDKCSALKQVDLPESLIIISHGVFRECTSLEEIVIPKNINSLEGKLFQNATSLRKVTCLGEIKDIYDDVFNNTALEELILDTTKIEYLGKSVFANTSYYGLGYPVQIDRVLIGTYENNKGVVNLVLPDYVKIIRSSAYSNCTNLVSVDLNKVEIIDSYAFKGCAFNEIKIPSTMTLLASGLFEDCQKLETVYLPSTITQIDGDVFKSCVSLNSIYFDGTLDQWNLVSKKTDGDNWYGEDSKPNQITVYCNDNQTVNY